VFNNLGQLPLFPDRSIAEISGKSAPDRKLADELSSYWTNFAKTGDPNGRGLPRWKRHQRGKGDEAAILDADPASEKLPDPARLAFVDKAFARQQEHAAH
jgi:para-nitrobenzyl esterase